MDQYKTSTTIDNHFFLLGEGCKLCSYQGGEETHVNSQCGQNILDVCGIHFGFWGMMSGCEAKCHNEMYSASHSFQQKTD